VFVSVTGAFGTVDEALVVPYAERIGLPAGYLGLLAATIPVGTLLATMVVAGGKRDHHSLLRTAGWCGVITSALAAPLFWFEATGWMAFVAFAISGGMFAVSIPTNTVIGLRLTRDTRASAMGIAVGVLMGSQALGAAVGGLVASVVGSPRGDRRRAGGGRRLQPVGGGHDPRRRQAPRAAAPAHRRTPAAGTRAGGRGRGCPCPRPSCSRNRPWRPPTPSSTSWPWRASSSRRPVAGEPAAPRLRIPGHAPFHLHRSSCRAHGGDRRVPRVRPGGLRVR
jgi:hypothetical protein